MRLISVEDIRDVYIKTCQRGVPFLFSKLSVSKENRTKSSFNQTDIPRAYWLTIPMVRERCNKLITGDETVEYEEYMSRKLELSDFGVKMLSVGSGVCSHELKLAELNPNWDVTCVDFSEKLLYEAARTARANDLQNIHFVTENIYNYQLSANEYDIVFFHASLHHFKNMDMFLQKMHDALNPSGRLVINEYVGARRMLYDKSQIAAVNTGLEMLDDRHKEIYKTRLKKERYYGSGWIRMVMSDPSECVESDRIMPVIHSLFRTVEEKGYGGNILMPLLKDLSHHFMEPTEENKRLLRELFEFEDNYLQCHQSDFVFGIYEK